MPHLESKTKLIMTASVNRYINPLFYISHGLHGLFTDEVKIINYLILGVSSPKLRFLSTIFRIKLITKAATPKHANITNGQV